MMVQLLVTLVVDLLENAEYMASVAGPVHLVIPALEILCEETSRVDDEVQVVKTSAVLVPSVVALPVDEGKGEEEGFVLIDIVVVTAISSGLRRRNSLL